MSDQSWISDLLRGPPGPPGPQGVPGLGGFVPWSGSIVSVGNTIGAGTSTFFNTHGLNSLLAMRTPDIASNGTVFVTGEAGRDADYLYDPAVSLSDINTYPLENPLDGQLYPILYWGLGSGGGVANPRLPYGSKYGWMLVTVAAATMSGFQVYWMNILK